MTVDVIIFELRVFSYNKLVIYGQMRLNYILFYFSYRCEQLGNVMSVQLTMIFMTL